MDPRSVLSALCEVLLPILNKHRKHEDERRDDARTKGLPEREGCLRLLYQLITETEADETPTEIMMWLDEHGNNSLHHAAMCGDVGMMRRVLEYNVPLGIENGAGKTAMQLAQEGNHKLCVDLLLERLRTAALKSAVARKPSTPYASRESRPTKAATSACEAPRSRASDDGSMPPPSFIPPHFMPSERLKTERGTNGATDGTGAAVTVPTGANAVPVRGSGR